MKEREEMIIELEDEKLKRAQINTKSKEGTEKTRKKSDEIVDKAEKWSASGWESMSDKQAKIYNAFIKWSLRIMAVMLILLTIVFPPCIIISVILFYMSFKFDAKKVKEDYKGNKSFLLVLAGVLLTVISLALPPIIILAIICFIAAYKEKKKI